MSPVTIAPLGMFAQSGSSKSGFAGTIGYTEITVIADKWAGKSQIT